MRARLAILAALVLLPVAAFAQLPGLSLDWMADVWHPLAASARFMLSCPFDLFTGATCSDGRTVTTTRATEVPCQLRDGTWGTAAINTACIAPGGVAGVESYGAVTNYWVNSTTPGLWTIAAGTPDVSGNTITDDAAGATEGRTASGGDPASGETYTTTCLLSAGTTTKARVITETAGGTGGFNICNVTLTTTPTRYACTHTLTADSTGIFGTLYVGHVAADTGSIIASQCQLEKSPTPGRRCDSGGTATTCGADQHTVSTTGFPTRHLEIELNYVPAAAAGSWRILARSDRMGNPRGGFSIFLSPSNVLFFEVFSEAGVSTSINSGLAVSLTAGAVTRIKAVLRDTSAQIWQDGALEGSGTLTHTLTRHHTEMALGHEWGSAQINGTVSLTYIGAPR